MSLFKKVGKNIESLRAEKGFSLDKVVEEMNNRGATLTVEIFKEIEEGKWSLSLPFFHHLGEILECKNDDFMIGVEDEKSLLEMARESMGELSEEEELFFDEIQTIIEVLIAQEKLYKGELDIMKPGLWKYTHNMPNPLLKPV